MKHWLIIFILSFSSILPTVANAENSAKAAANLYKKGLYAMKNNQCENAKKYFLQAIQLIPRDNRNLRTFGRNTTKYFPNKRLKRLKKQCKSVITKKPELKPSKVVAKAPPVIVKPIKVIPLSIKVNKPKINHKKGTAIISGIITGNPRSRLRINSTLVGLKNNHFSSQIKVPYGRSTIKLSLTYQQQKIDRQIKIKRYRPKPKPLKMAILSPKQSKISTLQDKIEFKIKVQGDSKALVVKINGKKSTDKNKVFSQVIDLKKGQNTINIEAKNKYKTLREQYQVYRKTPLVLTLKSKKLMNIAGKVTVMGKVEADNEDLKLFINNQKFTAKAGQFKYQINVRNQKRIKIKAISGEQETIKVIQIINDNNPLELIIKHPQNKFQTREKSIKISGQLNGGNQPKLTMNNTLLKLKNGQFDYTVSLNTGRNLFKFKTTDKVGRSDVKNLIIEKVKPLKIIIAQGDYIVSKEKNMTLTGRIDGVIGKANLSIDNKNISLQADGTFKYKVSSEATEQKVQIVVSDDSQQTVKKTIRIISE